MTEILLFAHDHTASGEVTVEAAAGLFSPFDLITAQVDGWMWGDAEMAHPWMRIIRWTAMSEGEAQALMGPAIPQLDSSGTPKTLWQRCATYLDLSDPRLPEGFKNWWADEARAQPIFVIPDDFGVSPAELKKLRPAVPDPNYLGEGMTAQGISS